MAERRGKEPLPQVQWKEEKRVLTLEKIPVLELDEPHYMPDIPFVSVELP